MTTQENPKKQKMASTQEFLPISEIKEGVVKMKNGSLRAIVIVSSVNFQLKSEREKDAMISSYQGFLNALNFPIQIMTQSRKTQLDDYLNKLREKSETENNALLKAQIDQYILFVGGLIEEANVMDKRFYVVVPYYPTGAEQVEQVSLIKKLFGTKAPVIDFETQKMELMQRVELVVGGLSAVGLRCVVLDTEELIELFYSVYNPDMTQSENLAKPEELESPMITSTGGNNNV